MIKSASFEYQTIKLIGLKAIKKIVSTGEFIGSQFDKLFELYQDEMPYGTQKARTGDPQEFILNQLSTFHVLKGEGLMAKKIVCDRKKSIMDPCFCTDGPVALCGNGKCLTCGKSQAEIETPTETVPAKPEEVITLNPEQMAEMKKIHKAIYKFSQAMEEKMCVALVKGKKGWNTDPAWAFKERMEKCLDNISKSNDIENECIDLSNFCMFIWKRVESE